MAAAPDEPCAPCAKRPRRQDDVALDVSGTALRVPRGTLRNLGDGVLDHFCEIATDEPILLDFPLATFTELHGAMIVARSDLLAAIRMLHWGLRKRSGAVLRELLQFLGLHWLFGAWRPLPVPFPGHDGLHRSIASVIALLSEGALRQLSNEGCLPFVDNGKLPCPGHCAPKLGDISLVRECVCAAGVFADPFVLSDRPQRCTAPSFGSAQCYIPHCVFSGDRLIIDVGPGRIMQLDRVILGLSMMPVCSSDALGWQEHKFDAIRRDHVLVNAVLEATGGADTQEPIETDSVRFLGHVKERQHTPVAARNFNDEVKVAPQTCSLLIGEVSVSEQPPLIGRMFAVTLDWVGGGIGMLYCCDIFGRILDIPLELGSHNITPPFVFDRRSQIAISSSSSNVQARERERLERIHLVPVPQSEEEGAEVDADATTTHGDEDAGGTDMSELLLLFGDDEGGDVDATTTNIRTAEAETEPLNQGDEADATTARVRVRGFRGHEDSDAMILRTPSPLVIGMGDGGRPLVGGMGDEGSDATTT